MAEPCQCETHRAAREAEVRREVELAEWKRRALDAEADASQLRAEVDELRAALTRASAAP